MNTLDDLLDALMVADIEVGFPERRAELARTLHGEGVTAADVGLLAQHCRLTVEGDAGAVARVLFRLLTDPAGREARLVDLRAVHAAKTRRASQESRPPGDTPVRPFSGPTEGEDRDRWDHDRRCMVALARIRGDRRTEAEVAAELGVTVEALQPLLERGRQLIASPTITPPRGPSPKQADKITRDSEARVREFRSRMRHDSANRGQRRDREPPQWNFTALRREMERIVQRLRDTGVVDLIEIVPDRLKQGALATLEADGVILRDGPPDAWSRQKYRIAVNDAQRAEFRAALSAWNQRPENMRGGSMSARHDHQTQARGQATDRNV